MIPSKFMNELLYGLAKVVENITHKKIRLPHHFEYQGIMDDKKLRKNFNAILKAFEKGDTKGAKK